MMKLHLLLAAAPLLVLPVASAAAQSGTTTGTASTRAATARDSLKIEMSPELQRQLDELAATLDRLGRRVANDPELRASAVKTAQSFVGVAQLMIVQQTDLLQEALRTASERLAEVAAQQRRLR